MRTFTRYNTHLAIEILMPDSNIETERLSSISYGGMQLNADIPLAVGETFAFRLPALNSSVQFFGEVKWCHNADNHYDIGVEFVNNDSLLTENIVEQVYYIEEHYTQQREAGRKINMEDAAAEWMDEQRYL